MDGADDRGFALVIVLWALGIAALLAASFASRLHTQTLIAKNQVALANAEAIADGGVTLAAVSVARIRQQGQSVVSSSGAVHLANVRCEVGDVELSIHVEDEAGKIDLNTADDRLLAMLFVGLGLGSDAASRLVDRIVDFRDEDDLRRLNGAESREYRVEGRAWSPKNARFESVAELEQVLDMPADFYRGVRPFLTTAQLRSGIDPTVADRRLLALLSRGATGANPTSSEAMPAGNGAPLIPPELAVPSSKRAFLIRSIARRSAGQTFVREAVIEVIDRPDRPYIVRSWSRGADVDARWLEPGKDGTGGSVGDCRELNSLP